MEIQISKKLSYRYPNLKMKYCDFNLISICNIDGEKCLGQDKDYEIIQSNTKGENLISILKIPTAFAINCDRCSRNNKRNIIKN